MSELETGQQFAGRYRVDATLGKGGFATVYRAWDEHANRSVALKVLHRAKGGYDRDTAARFVREVEGLARLRSPHAVRIFDHGRSQDGHLYIAFELVPGRDLSEMLEQGPLPAATVREILIQIARALQEAHEAGLIHRDIKPQNIRVFMNPDGTLHAKLLDFGITRPTDEATPQLTAAGTLLGTPRYMSPEQLRGAADVGPTTDVYSLGVVAFEMLMGTGAMQGNSVLDQIDRVLDTQFFALPGSVDEQVREVIGRMVSRSPRARYQSSRELLRALGTVPVEPTGGIGVHAATRASSVADSVRTLRGSPLVLVLMVAIAIFVVVLVLVLKDEPSESVERRRLGVLPPPQSTNAQPVPQQVGFPEDMGSDDDASSPGPLTPDCRPGGSPRGDGDSVKLSVQLSVRARTPRGYDSTKPTPVVVLVHRALDTGMQMMRDGKFSEVADEHGFILLLPKKWPVNLAEVFEQRDLREVVDVWSADDAGVLSSLIRAGLDGLCFDPARIFIVGFADGGRVLEQMPCESQIPIAGLGLVSSRTRELTCKARPPPVIQFAGTKDLWVPIAEGPNCSREPVFYAEHEQKWRDWYRCGEKKTKLRKGPNANCWTWDDCEVRFESCHLNGGRGFKWADPHRAMDPTIWLSLGRRGGGFDPECEGPRPDFHIAEALWEFFDKHGKVAPASVEPTSDAALTP